MTASDSDVVQIVEPCAELRADQWVGWRVELASDAVGLETEDSSSHEVDIVSPSGNNWVPVDGLARDPGGSETLLEALPGFSKGDFLVALVESVSNE